MKKRNSFVSNSSSCSFVVYCNKNNVDKFFQSIDPLKFKEMWHCDDVIEYNKDIVKEYISKFDKDERFIIYLGLNDCQEFDFTLGYMIGRLLLNNIKCEGYGNTEYDLKELCKSN